MTPIRKPKKNCNMMFYASRIMHVDLKYLTKWNMS